MPELQWLISAFPNFVRYVIVGFGLMGLFLLAYTLITPWREFTLIRAGNSAAATALIGALLGFCLPLANTIAQSSSVTDVVLWALVALAVQVVVMEPTGMDTFIACRHDGVDLAAVFRERHDFAPGSTIRLQPDLQRAHLFDAGSGQRLAA